MRAKLEFREARPSQADDLRRQATEACQGLTRLTDDFCLSRDTVARLKRRLERGENTARSILLETEERQRGLVTDLREHIRIGADIERRLRAHHSLSEQKADAAESETRHLHGQAYFQSAARELRNEAAIFQTEAERLAQALEAARAALKEGAYREARVSKGIWKLAVALLGLIFPPLFTLQLGPLCLSFGVSGLSLGVPLMEIGSWSFGFGVRIGPDSEGKAEWGFDVSPAEPMLPPVVIC
jgi:hypothetical protein